MTLELFGIIMKKFVDLLKLDNRKNRPALLYADRPACHDSIKIIRDLYDENIHLVWFVSNSSQITQPLDGAPYANLKKNLKIAKDNEILRRTLTGEPTNQVVAELIPIVERQSFTKDVLLLIHYYYLVFINIIIIIIIIIIFYYYIVLLTSSLPLFLLSRL
jgi:hypothetical protein